MPASPLLCFYSVCNRKSHLKESRTSERLFRGLFLDGAHAMKIKNTKKSPTKMKMPTSIDEMRECKDIFCTSSLARFMANDTSVWWCERLHFLDVIKCTRDVSKAFSHLITGINISWNYAECTDEFCWVVCWGPLGWDECVRVVQNFCVILRILN